VPGFVQPLVWFRSALDGSRFGAVGALRHQIGGEGTEQIVPARGNGSLVGEAEQTGPLLECVDGAFEGELVDRAVMLPGGVEHDAANQVVGDGLHADFLLHQVGRFAAQDVEAEGRFDISEVKFYLPTPGVQFHDRFVGVLFGVEQGGGQNHFFSSKPGFAHAVAHDAHFNGFGQCTPQSRIPMRPALRFGPELDCGLGLFAGAQADDEVQALLHQAGKEGPTAEAPVCHDDLAGCKPAEELTGQPGIVDFPVAHDKATKVTGGQIEQCDEFARGETATGGLTAHVVEGEVVRFCIRHGDTGAVYDFDGASQPKIGAFGLGLEPSAQPLEDFIEQSEIEPTPRLTVGAGAVIGSGLAASQKPGLNSAHRFAATAPTLHHLPQKRCKGHHRREQPVALTFCRFEQLSRNKARDQCSQSIDTGSLRHDLRGLGLGPARTHQIGKPGKIHRLVVHGLM